MNYFIEHKPPTAVEFCALRAKVGWGATDLVMAQASLDNSLFHVSVRVGTTIIGMGRVIGDGVMFFYLQDIVVDPAHQQQGVGHAIMLAIEDYLAVTVKKGATIALLSAQGKEHFYSRYGYLERSGSPLGKGMCKFI